MNNNYNYIDPAYTYIDPKTGVLRNIEHISDKNLLVVFESLKVNK